MVNNLKKHFSCNYFKELILSSLQLIYPLTIRKIWCYFTITMLAIIIEGELLHIPSFWNYITKIVKIYSLEFAIFILLIDPFLQTVAMLTFWYNDEPLVDEDESSRF